MIKQDIFTYKIVNTIFISCIIYIFISQVYDLLYTNGANYIIYIL